MAQKKYRRCAISRVWCMRLRTTCQSSPSFVRRARSRIWIARAAAGKTPLPPCLMAADVRTRSAKNLFSIINCRYWLRATFFLCAFELIDALILIARFPRCFSRRCCSAVALLFGLCSLCIVLRLLMQLISFFIIKLLYQESTNWLM